MPRRQSDKSVVEKLNLGNKIRDLRLKRGFTLNELAERTGFSIALLSQIENNIVSPPISTLWKIAEVLGVKIYYFFQDTPIEGEDFVVVRGGKGKPVARRETYPNLSFYSLAFGLADRKMEPFMVVFDNDEFGKTPHSHEGEEFLYVLEGSLLLKLGSETIELSAGDSIYYDSKIPHCVEGKKGARFLAVVIKH
ncbi:MAG: helix-turn-helix domain-containing protein [Thermosulfidibacteraceae bacterium]|jgi:transcriptional regulator with XRE-family HTH domain